MNSATKQPRNTFLRPLGIVLTCLAAVVLAAPADAGGRRFDRAVNLIEVNSIYQEKSPCISLDGLEIFFQSNRESADATTIWHARREATHRPFSTPRVALTNGATPEVSADALTL